MLFVNLNHLPCNSYHNIYRLYTSVHHFFLYCSGNGWLCRASHSFTALPFLEDAAYAHMSPSLKMSYPLTSPHPRAHQVLFLRIVTASVITGAYLSRFLEGSDTCICYRRRDTVQHRFNICPRFSDTRLAIFHHLDLPYNDLSYLNPETFDKFAPLYFNFFPPDDPVVARFHTPPQFS